MAVNKYLVEVTTREELSHLDYYALRNDIRDVIEGLGGKYGIYMIGVIGKGDFEMMMEWVEDE